MSDEHRTDEEQAAPDEGAAGAGEATLHGAPVTERHGQKVVHTHQGNYHEVVEALTHEDGYEMCVDLTAVDQLANQHRSLPPGVEPQRFEVVVGLLDLRGRRRVRVRCQVPGDDPVVPSLWHLHPGTEALEREVFDMYGIRFDGHPDLTRVLMPEDWHGHPLRKDYPVGRIPVQFKAAPGAR